MAEVEIQQKPEVLKVLLRTDENVEISVQMEKALSAPVEKGQKVGEVWYILDKNIIGKYDVLTRSGLKKTDIFLVPEKMYGALFLLYKMEYILRGFALTEIENHDTVNIVRGKQFLHTFFLFFSIDNLRRL